MSGLTFPPQIGVHEDPESEGVGFWASCDHCAWQSETMLTALLLIAVNEHVQYDCRVVPSAGRDLSRGAQ